MRLLLVCILLVCIIQPAFQKTKDEWKSRTVYQLLTDRFAKGDGSTGGCDLHNYCGGNYKGIVNHLDYIANMGFDAIWISPVVDNYDNGYHGYWARNVYDVNGNFGSKDDLKNFVNACHAKNIWVMVDIVGNHMGNQNQDFSRNAPFNDNSHYHDRCDIQDYDFQSHNMKNLQNCRLAGLADLNSENPYVQQEMYKWINWLVNEYKFDGIRIDTIIEVPKFFWQAFTQAAGVYSVGEAFDGDQGFIAQYIGSVDALLNYPQFFTLRDVFLHGKDMTDIKNFYAGWSKAAGANNLQYMGNFNDNHDNARFLSGNVGESNKFSKFGNQTNIKTERFLQEINEDNKHKQFKCMTAFTLAAVGVPMIYYGTEQAFGGGNDPDNREVLWNNLNQDHEMYKFIQTINRARKATDSASQPQIERYVDAEIFAFSRGFLFAAFSSKLDRSVHKVITYHPYAEGQTICNIFYATDCVKIVNGSFDVYVNYGEVKIYTPK